MPESLKLKELSFLVYGLGLSGRSVVKFFKKKKIKNFKVWDDKQKNIYKYYRSKNLTYTLEQVDYIILSPGISLLKNKNLSKFKKKIITDIDLFYLNNIKSKRGRKSKFQSLIIEKDFEPENPKQLEELDENTCKWTIGHPDEKNFYFCGRSSLKDFSYCKLHLLYAYQPKGKKDEDVNKEEVPEFIEKKNRSA